MLQIFAASGRAEERAPFVLEASSDLVQESAPLDEVPEARLMGRVSLRVEGPRAEVERERGEDRGDRQADCGDRPLVQSQPLRSRSDVMWAT